MLYPFKNSYLSGICEAEFHRNREVLIHCWNRCQSVGDHCCQLRKAATKLDEYAAEWSMTRRRRPVGFDVFCASVFARWRLTRPPSCAASGFLGNPAGDVTVVEFMDYRCGYCRRAHPEVMDLINLDGKIRLVIKELPILGEQSLLASSFAIATRVALGDAAYEAVHHGLMTLRGDVSDASLVGMANGLGLDSAAILGALDDPLVSATIEHNRALAQRLSISGTPSFVFGDQMVRGYAPLDDMQQIVAMLRDMAN